MTEPISLVRQFATLKDYEEDFISDFAPASQARIRELLTRPGWLATRHKIEAELAAGGELWAWETSGFRQLAGAAGLAVVRGGKVVRRWQLARS